MRRKLNNLVIPKIDIQPLPVYADSHTQKYIKYSEIVRKTKAGEKILQILNEDTRVNNLNGKMISCGSSAQKFEVDSLAMWFLWCVNEHGKKNAIHYLDSFLNNNEIEVINTLWVLGLSVDESISLKNGFSIHAIKDMPDSRDKDFFIKESTMPQHQQYVPIPMCAITKSCLINKAWGNVPPASTATIQSFWEANHQLNDIALLLNAVNGIFCIPYYSTSYPAPTTPLGIFASSGGGLPLYEVRCFGFTKLLSESKDNINELISAYDKLQKIDKNRIQVILSRLSQAKRRIEITDKILDLGIALEMLLLDKNIKEQVSLTFRLRGSWFLGDSSEDRIAVYKQLKDIYEYRSQVAHSGVLCEGKTNNITRVMESFPDFLAIAEKVCQKIIIDGVPNWDKLVLNAID